MLQSRKVAGVPKCNPDVVTRLMDFLSYNGDGTTMNKLVVCQNKMSLIRKDIPPTHFFGRKVHQYSFDIFEKENAPIRQEEI